MVIIDETGAVVTDPDLEMGRLEARSMPVTHTWVVDVEEQSHEEVIAEYPETGGKDIAIVVDVEEQGHWETRGEDGAVVEHFDGVILEDTPREQPVADTWAYAVYVPYTDEELAEIEERRAAMEAEAARMAEREAWLAGAPDQAADLDEAVVELYEAQAQAQLETDEALTALYEAMLSMDGGN